MHTTVSATYRARCGIRRVQVRLVFEGVPSGLLSAAPLALCGLLGRRGAGRLPRRLNAFREAAAAGAAAAAAGEGAAVTAVTSALSLALSIVPFVRRGRMTESRDRDASSQTTRSQDLRDTGTPLGPYRLDRLPVYRRYTGLPATLPAGLSDPTGVNSSSLPSESGSGSILIDIDIDIDPDRSGSAYRYIDI